MQPEVIETIRTICHVLPLIGLAIFGLLIGVLAFARSRGW